MDHGGALLPVGPTYLYPAYSPAALQLDAPGRLQLRAMQHRYRREPVDLLHTCRSACQHDTG